MAVNRLSVVAGRHGTDERLQTSVRISLDCSRRQLARGCGSGGTDRGRSALRTPACRQEGSGGGAVGRQGGLACCGEKGSAWRGSAVWAKPGA